MDFKKLIAGVAGSLILGCGSGGGGGGGGSSGGAGGSTSTTYTSYGTINYSDNTGTTTVYTATFNIGLETLVITGGNYTITRSGAGCTSIESGSISFNTSTLYYTLSGRNIDNTPNANCTINYALTNGHFAQFSPQNWSHTLSEGALNNYTDRYFVKSDRIGLFNPDTTTGSGYSYYVYLKQ